MAHDARYVLASSPEAFGEALQQPIKDGNEMTFTDPSLHQRHSYGASKYLDEIACQHAARDGSASGESICWSQYLLVSHRELRAQRGARIRRVRRRDATF